MPDPRPSEVEKWAVRSLSSDDHVSADGTPHHLRLISTDYKHFRVGLSVMQIPIGPSLNELLPSMLILFVQLGLAAVCLLRLRYREMHDMARVVWALVVVLIPWLGPLMFFIVNPGRSVSSKSS